MWSGWLKLRLCEDMRLQRNMLRWCTRVLWDGLSAVARLALHFVSTDSRHRQAQRQLREEFRNIRVTERDVQAAQVRGSWDLNQWRLRGEVLARDARGFLTWGVIRETMFPPPYAAFTRTELQFLRRLNWTEWRHVIRERAAGLPFPSFFFPRSSANAIHHAYHLGRFEVETGLRIRQFGTMVEFGGGYGSLCRIAHRHGFEGQSVIFDLPGPAALQRYYLEMVGIKNVWTVSELELLAGKEESFPKPKLFVATWSLSESPVGLRRQVAKAVAGFDAFLLAYQSEFGGVRNEEFFREWESWFPEVKWMLCPMEHMPASTYLFGVRQTAAVLDTG